jgi:creatinine amidohydrolase/Fe(II)-dependent formamide hydrolase-like protein
MTMLRTFCRLRRLRWLAVMALGLPVAHAAGGSAVAVASVQIEELTSPELRARIAAGATTVLVPIGGTEQSGPHIVLGKHNVRVRALAGQIAARLGNAVVAPVLSYVPEGAIAPPGGHMRFSGTISIPEAAFESILEGAARSLCQHGLRQVFFLGDHGGYQASLARAARRVPQSSACSVHALPVYYQAAQADFADALKLRGFGSEEIGLHAGLADTALSLAVDAALVRGALLAAGAQAGKRGGVDGDPRRATAALGQAGLRHIIEASVAAIHAIEASAPPPPRNSQP